MARPWWRDYGGPRLLALAAPGYRIADFQLVTLKEIAEFTLLQSPGYSGRATLPLQIPGELDQDNLGFEKPILLYASPHNPGARALAEDMAQACRGTGPSALATLA